MKIAVPSDDHVNVSSHFGRSPGFLVFEVVGGRIESHTYRPRSACLDAGATACACDVAKRPERHQEILDVLEGCSVVVARGMGTQLYDDLVSCGIDVALTDVDDARAAAALFLAGTLPERSEIGCDGEIRQPPRDDA